jgi:hypothetical protein
MKFFHDSICIEKQSITNDNYSRFNIQHLYSEHNSYFSYIFSLYNIPHSFENDKISFECLSIQSFKEYLIHNDFTKLPYEEVIKFIYDIGILIKSLEKYNNFIFCFSLKDIIVVNNSIFLFINTNKIVNKSNRSNYIQLNYPISTEKELQFISNKINIDSLPFNCHYSYSYYNLGLMIVYLLSGQMYESESCKENNNNLNMSFKKKNDELLLPYIGTKLHFFLMRCLSDNSNDRRFLYI